MLGFVSALSLVLGGNQPCQAPLPHGPAVPAPIVLKTDCGWFRLTTDGDVSRLGGNWGAMHTRPAEPRYTIRRTRSGRYLVVQAGEVVWRSRGVFRNEAGNWAFGTHAFAFDSWARRGVFLTDLRGPERLVIRGRQTYPLGFGREGELLVANRRTIFVVSRDGTVLRRLRYRRASSYAFDDLTKVLYFVSPAGVLTSLRGSTVRRIVTTRERGWISLLGRRLLTFTTPRRLAIVRRGDGSSVASSSWRGVGRELDAAVAVSDDGRLFAFRVAKSPGIATVYVLRAGEHRARPMYRHRFQQAGCGFDVVLIAHSSSFLYQSGHARAAVITADGMVTRLTSVLLSLPRKVHAMPVDAYWEADFTS